MMLFRSIIAAIGIVFLMASPSSHALTGTRYLLLTGGSVLWTPLNIGTLVAWWDAQYLPNLTFNGSTISAWKDRKSGTVASQVTGTNQPTWSATARNNKPGIAFVSGSGQHLVFTPTGFPSGAGNSWIALAGQSTNPSFGYAFSYGGNGIAGDRRSVGSNSPPLVYADYDGKSNPSAVAWGGTDHFLEASYNGTAASIIVDGGAAASNTFTISTPLTFGQIGAEASSASGGTFWNGVAQQIIVINTILSTCQQQKLEGWESWYDGKSGANLPSNHPYKAGPPLVGGAC